MKKQPQHIPTLIALIILMLGISSFVFVVEKGTNLFSQASGNPAPRNVLVSNITDSSFSVSWITDTKTNGFITYFSDQTPQQTALSDQAKQTTHLVTLTGLQESTTYSFTIHSEGKTFEQNGQPFRIQTGGALVVGENPFVEPIYGTVKTGDDQPAKGSIVYVTAPSIQTIATITGADGRFVLPMSQARAQNLSEFAYVFDETPVTITFLGADKTTATVTTILGNTRPLPEVILGKEYTFPNKLESHIKAFFAGLKPTLVTSVHAAYLVSIIQPSENAGVPSQTPQFKGTGVPDKEVIATVGNPPQVGRVTVNKEGNWSWVPTIPLSPNSYLLTITTTNESNQLTALSRPFTILKSGSAVLDAATPSATPKGTATPSATPIASASASPSATPKPLPVSGSLMPTLVMISMGFLFIIFGSAAIIL